MYNKIENEIISLIKLHGPKQITAVIKGKNNTVYFDYLKKKFNFLGEDRKITEYAYCLINKINEKQICPICNEKKLKFKGLNLGYNKYCSVKCSNKSEETKINRENSNIKKYGVKNVFQRNDIILKNKENNTIEKKKKTRKKYEKTMMERHGYVVPLKNPIILKDFKKTCLSNFGYDNPMKNSKIKLKAKKETIKNHGEYPIFKTKKFKNNHSENNPMKLIENKEKQKNTNLSRRGVKYPMQDKKVNEKQKKSLMIGRNKLKNNLLNETLKKYNIISSKYQSYITFDNNNYKVSCKKCGKTNKIDNHNIYNRLYVLNASPCIKCFPINKQFSIVEKKFVNFIKEFFKGEIIENDRNILNGKEIDIFIPSLMIGIEIHGTYWHTDKFADKNYHYEKMKLAEKKGVQLLQFFDDEIEKGMMLVYSLLMNKGVIDNSSLSQIILNKINTEYNTSLKVNNIVKYYGRNTNIKKIDYSTVKEFLNTYHIQGSDISSFRYGLFDSSGRLLSLMTFKKMSRDKNQIKNNSGKLTYELSRYVTLPGITIVGGFSKLIKTFLKEIGDIDLITYSNLRYSDEFNNVYLRNNFINKGFTGINYYYFFEGKKHHRFGFRKDRLYYNILPKYGINNLLDYKEESENSLIEKLNDVKKINKIYDCGHIKWEFSL